MGLLPCDVLAFSRRRMGPGVCTSRKHSCSGGGAILVFFSTEGSGEKPPAPFSAPGNFGGAQVPQLTGSTLKVLNCRREKTGDCTWRRRSAQFVHFLLSAERPRSESATSSRRFRLGRARRCPLFHARASGLRALTPRAIGVRSYLCTDHRRWVALAPRR